MISLFLSGSVYHLTKTQDALAFHAAAEQMLLGGSRGQIRGDPPQAGLSGREQETRGEDAGPAVGAQFIAPAALGVQSRLA